MGSNGRTALMHGAKHAERILESDRGQHRSRKAAKLDERSDVGNDPGTSRRVQAGDRQYNRLVLKYGLYFPATSQVKK